MNDERTEGRGKKDGPMDDRASALGRSPSAWTMDETAKHELNSLASFLSLPRMIPRQKPIRLTTFYSSPPFIDK